MNLLLIVDMQQEFPTAHKPKTIAECQKLVRQAKRNQDVIIVLEYKGYGSTLSPIKRTIGEYPNCYFVFKTCDNGGWEVHKALTERGIKVDKILVCGVNSHACVQDTATCLAGSHGYQVEVIKKACNHGNVGKVWSEYPKLANLRKI
jgi:nicotinamidase-related amidase